MTADVDTAVEAVRLNIDVPVGHNRVSVWRVGPSGTKAYVRNLVEAVVQSGETILRDFEAPIGVPLTYTAETWTAPDGVHAAQTVAFTLPDDGCADTWLTDLVRAQNTMQITMEEMESLDYEYPVGVHSVLDRRTPVVTSDIANAPSFELSFLTASDTERQQARAILGNGVPVLLRTPPANGIGNLYFSVTTWTEQRITRLAREPSRRFITSCVQVDRPDPGLFKPLVPVIYSTITAEFASYAELSAERTDYDSLLYNYDPAAGTNVVPWPPTDV